MKKYKTVFVIKSLQDGSILADNIESEDIQNELNRVNLELDGIQKNLGRVVYALSSKTIVVDEDDNGSNQ